MTRAADAALGAAVLAVDPAGLGGACLRSPPQAARSDWLALLRDLLPQTAALRRIPCNIPDGRLLGGLDLTATLKANRPIAERGVLASAHGGVIVIAMAERLSAHIAGCINNVLDAGVIAVGREGLTIEAEAEVGVVALDEGIGDDEAVPSSLLDRLALLIDLSGFDSRMPLVPLQDAGDVSAARRLLPKVEISDELLEALCGTALALGAGSLRISGLAVRVARIIAALDGRTSVTSEDASTAGRLVLAPRATRLPQSDSPEPQPEPQPEPEPAEGNAAPPADAGAPPPQSAADDSPPSDDPEGALDDLILAAVQAAIPPGLLASLRGGAGARAAAARAGGRAGEYRRGGLRGRPVGVQAGQPKGGARLNVIETLRAAAPWQALRGRSTPTGARLRIDPVDFRVTRHRQRTVTLTIFAVDASGSSALNRLAEAKGAVELLLADCYVRRDQVAVITFRGKTAELLLPPTRSLVRAKRTLAGVPGGGGTPLAAALDAAAAVAEQAMRRGETPLVVMLSDGRANVARNGTGGREAAHADALRAARRLRGIRVASLFVDTAARPGPVAAEVAAAMNARYVPLPFASARALSAVVSAAAGGT